MTTSIGLLDFVSSIYSCFGLRLNPTITSMGFPIIISSIGLCFGSRLHQGNTSIGFLCEKFFDVTFEIIGRIFANTSITGVGGRVSFKQNRIAQKKAKFSIIGLALLLSSASNFIVDTQSLQAIFDNFWKLPVPSLQKSLVFTSA